jgi:hypothetical protein
MNYYLVLTIEPSVDLLVFPAALRLRALDIEVGILLAVMYLTFLFWILMMFFTGKGGII